MEYRDSIFIYLVLNPQELPLMMKKYYQRLNVSLPKIMHKNTQNHCFENTLQREMRDSDEDALVPHNAPHTPRHSETDMRLKSFHLVIFGQS